MTSDGIQDNEVINSVIRVLANESGCSLNELVDDASFTNLGIDSVMAITALSMIRQKVRLELAASFFVQNETVGAAKRSLYQLISLSEEAQKSTKSSSITEESIDTSFSEASTPNLASDITQDLSKPFIKIA